jgi:hypothetical protein
LDLGLGFNEDFENQRKDYNQLESNSPNYSLSPQEQNPRDYILLGPDDRNLNFLSLRGFSNFYNLNMNETLNNQNLYLNTLNNLF